MKRKQYSFNFLDKPKLEFGGSLLTGKRKEKRPISLKKPMHFVLKSQNAQNRLSFVSHQRQIQKLIKDISLRYRIKVYDFAINFNHIHLVVQLPHSETYKKWIRHLTSAIVDYLSRTIKAKLRNFFTLRPYSRIITCWRQFKNVMNYQILNQLEIVGLRPHKNSNKKLRRGRANLIELRT
jgi:REP element-mobilizing transposase RayT